MKRYIIIALLVFAPLFAKADSTVFGFMDGKFYNESQKLVYFCFLDGSCFDVNYQPVLITIYHPPTIAGITTSTPDTLPVPPTPMPTPPPTVAGTPATCTLSWVKDSTPFPNGNYGNTVTWASDLPDTVKGTLYGVLGQNGGNYNYTIVGTLNGNIGTLPGVSNISPYKAVFGNTSCITDN